MSKQELNKKLAEWVGIQGEPDFTTAITSLTGRDIPVKVYGNLPNFTQSLDACFKWLVPKLDAYSIRFSRANNCEIVVWNGKSHDHYDSSPTKSDILPALALCLAIEKLIDSEK